MPFDLKMEAVNTIILLCGTIIVPALVFFVNSQVTAQLAKLEARLGDKFEAHRMRLEAYMKEANDRAMDSMTRSANLDKRLSLVESGHESIQSRIDALVHALDSRNLREEVREAREHHA